MKKIKLFAASLAALALAGCTSDEYLGGANDPKSEAIGFGTGMKAVTRANFTGGAAAEKLNNNFVVYGFKTSAAEEADGTGDQKVFDRYNVNYTAGTANTTESNTADWEYVGYANHDGTIDPQTIKYWDYEAKSYVFSAVSGTGITATKTLSGTTKYDKGWTVEIPAGGDISTLYASDRKPVAPADYQKQVDLTFRSLVTKIRFAMYETVPGYEVHIDKFYYNDGSWQNTETNFAIDGTFKTANAEAETPLTITYYDDASGIENRPKVTYADGDVTSADYKIFGANIQATPAIGTTSAEATYDQSDKSYTLILPYESSALSTPAENTLELYVDYTLTSTDGSGEEIHVKHASAKVPTNFNQWKPNFAYTYIFKISDNTNGTTGTPGDPNDPTVDPTDPKGLFPITFDAVVVTDETDVQETITSVADPSITTYQKGVVVTANDEYVAGDNIYFENGAADVSGYKVYEVKNFGTEVTTEEVVANYLKNFCVLTEVTTTDASTTDPAGIPLSNGTYIKKTANQAYFFTPEAGKTYVICDEATPTKHYKVVKVAGTPAAVTYTVGSDATIDAVAGTATITVKQGTVGVLGAAPCFTVTGEAGNKALKITDGAAAGEYTVSVDADAIKAGKANDTYTVSFDGNDVTITVNIAYALDAASVNIVAGNTTGATTTLKIAGAAADGDVTDVPAGITIEKTATGTYKVTAASDKAAGTYTAKIGGKELTIKVDSYKFTSDLVITKALTGSSTGTLTLQKNGDATGVAVTLDGVNTSIATVGSATDGVYTFTAVAGGSFDVTYENAKAKVTVNAYTIATPASIKKSTGIANIEVKCNGTAINAATASLVETAKPDGAVYTVSTNGKAIKFSGASKAGAYEFDYKVGTTVVAHVVVTVTE